MLSARFSVVRPGFRLDFSGEIRSAAASVLGPSGAGKSTALHAIAGHVRPAEGEIRIGDRVVFSSAGGVDLPPEARGVGLVHQDGLLFPHLSVERNLRFGFARRSRAARRIEPDRVVELLELSGLLRRRPAALSGGERQRVALGRALLASPDLLLLDEPLASLDVGLRRKILPYLTAVRDELGIPMLYVTHVVSEALGIASEVLVMAGGRVLAGGAFAEVIANPAVFAVARSLGLDNVIPGVVERGGAEGGTMLVRSGERLLKAPPSDLPAGTRVLLSIGAGEVLLAREAPSGLSARNALAAVVTGLDAVGEVVLVRLDAGFPLSVELTPDAVRDLGLAAGARVHAVMKTHSLRLL